MESFDLFCTDMRPKEPGGLENCYLLTNRIDLFNSLVSLNIIFNTASFAVEWSKICKFFAEQLSLNERLIEDNLVIH